MHGVSSAVGYDFSQNAMAEQRKIADQVEYLVTDKFVRETQIVEDCRLVLHPAVGINPKVDIISREIPGQVRADGQGFEPELVAS